MKKVDHYESLSRLYLRLNGFVTSNFIIHSAEKGNNLGELDHVGFRMPFHSQEDRKVDSSEYLDLSKDRIQVVIGDTKSGTTVNNIRFNDGLRKNKESIEKLCNWLGIFENVTATLIDDCHRMLNTKLSDQIGGYPEIDYDSPFGSFKIRFLLLCPNLPHANGNALKYIHGSEMINFCWKCLNTTTDIDSCSRTYSLQHWHGLERSVDYFKSIPNPGTIDEFCKAMIK